MVRRDGYQVCFLDPFPYHIQARLQVRRRAGWLKRLEYRNAVEISVQIVMDSVPADAARYEACALSLGHLSQRNRLYCNSFADGG